MNLTYCKKLWVVPLVMAGVLLVLAVLFSSLAMAADEAQVRAAIKDLSSATGQKVTSEEQAKSICNSEQYLDTCAEIGKKYNLYTSDEVKQVDAFLKEVKGKVLEDIKSCPDEECLFRVANELSKNIQAKNPTLATNLSLTTKIVEEKKAIVEAAKEVGVNFKDCEALDPDTASVDLLRKCVRLSKDTRIQKYIPQENRALAGQFDDSTVKLREALSAGKYKCGDNTLEGCGNYCLKPDTAGATVIPPVCKQIASEIFGAEGVKELENAHRQVGQVKDYYSKKFILTLSDGKELVGESQIRKTCDQAFSSQNIEIAKACGNFAVKNGFADQAEVEKGIKLMESFAQKGQNVNFDQCLTNPTACRDFIPADQQKQFDVGSQIFQIMKTEIGFDPSQCERGSVDEAIGIKCSEGSKRALVKIESLGLANQSKEARLIVQDIKSHVSEGENFAQKKDQFKQVFQQKGGPGGCKSESECFAYCSDPTHGAECISFGSQQGVSGFRGQEAIQKFQEYNQNIQKSSDITSSEYRAYPSEGRYPQYPGQGPYPGQDPRFTQPGPGYSPPPGQGQYYPPYPGPGPVGPSSECLAAIQSGDFVRAKTVCTSSVSLPVRSVPVCPASPYLECPVGQYRESFRNNDGCWIDGPCKPAPSYSPGPYPTGPYPTYSSVPTFTPSGDPVVDCQKSGGTWDSSTKYCKFPVPTYSVPPSGSPYPTYTPYPSNSSYPTYSPGPGIGICPTGYHSHGESGGFCMNDQENYGGTCYNSVGTSKITCPAQPTYSPYPYPSSSPTSSGSCPSGAHTIYVNNAGGYCMSDADTTKCGSLNSTSVSSFGSCSSYQTTATYSPAPGTSYTPYPSPGTCPTGQYWYWPPSGAGYCKVNEPYPTYSPGTSYTPYPSPGTCSSGQWWDYATNSCKLTTTPYPTTTTSYTPYPSTTTTYTPYPTTQYTPPPTYSPSPATYSPPPPTSVLYPHYIVAHCQQLGRTWNGSTCQANGLFARFYEGSGMANMLRFFYIVP